MLLLTDEILLEKNRNLILASASFSLSKENQSSLRKDHNSELITTELQKKIIKINRWMEFLDHYDHKYDIWNGKYGDIK